MKRCDLTLDTPEGNLACDEALLDLFEAGHPGEVLRFWEPTQYFVVVGYANQVQREVNLEFCLRNAIPVLRRCSGGGTVLQGPGCLNYSLVLALDGTNPLGTVTATNEFVMTRLGEAVRSLVRGPVEKLGHTDLTSSGLKFCGNAQRRRNRCVLFHGSFLLNLDFALMEKVLPLPSKQPEYRRNRSHTDFLMNLKVPAEQLKEAIAEACGATETLNELPVERVGQLVEEKYVQKEWNLKF